MPPKAKFTKEMIAGEALSLVREQGMEALTARNLAQRLGCSAKPIFGLYESMAQLKTEVIARAEQCMAEFTSRMVQSGEYPPYKASGMAYIRFAREEKELFRLLFMRDRSGEKITDGAELEEIVKQLVKSLKISEEKARMFHLEMWIYVHGIAVMLATSYLEWQEDFISNALTDAYFGLKYRYCGESET